MGMMGEVERVTLMIRMWKLWMDGDMGNVNCEGGKVMWMQSYMERGVVGGGC